MFHSVSSSLADELKKLRSNVCCMFTIFVDLSKESLILIFELKSVFPSSCNLVDPASSHMLVSKIKPCMSQYEFLHNETANGSLKQL